MEGIPDFDYIENNRGGKQLVDSENYILTILRTTEVENSWWIPKITSIMSAHLRKVGPIGLVHWKNNWIARAKQRSSFGTMLRCSRQPTSTTTWPPLPKSRPRSWTGRQSRRPWPTLLLLQAGSWQIRVTSIGIQLLLLPFWWPDVNLLLLSGQCIITELQLRVTAPFRCQWRRFRKIPWTKSTLWLKTDPSFLL